MDGYTTRVTIRYLLHEGDTGITHVEVFDVDISSTDCATVSVTTSGDKIDERETKTHCRRYGFKKGVRSLLNETGNYPRPAAPPSSPRFTVANHAATINRSPIKAEHGALNTNLRMSALMNDGTTPA